MDQISARILIETLRQTKNDGVVRIDEIASQTRSSKGVVKRILAKVQESTDSSGIRLSPETRFRLALAVAKIGGLQEVARALTWQEFERFGEECLVGAGFQTRKGLIIDRDGRRWQIDLVARKGLMILAFDCKQWNSPSYPSKFKNAAAHQKLATIALMRDLMDKKELSREGSCTLPIILTLFDPRTRVAGDVVLVSVDKLPDFLHGVTPYSEDLPFISIESPEVNPIRQTPASIMKQT